MSAHNHVYAPYRDDWDRDETEAQATAREIRLADRVTDLTAEAMRGLGPFWSEDEYKCQIGEAVRRALTGIALTTEERWNIVFLAVARAATEYAASVARDE